MRSVLTTLFESIAIIFDLSTHMSECLMNRSDIEEREREREKKGCSKVN